MEPLASFTDHHPDICNLQYEMTHITTEDAKLQHKHWKFPVVITSSGAAVSDSKVIVM